MESEEPKRHTGQRWKIRYIGGDYHNEEKIVRAPIKDVVEVAQPPRYLGNGLYEAGVASINYQRYVLRWVNDTPYYIWDQWIKDFDSVGLSVLAALPYESTNAKLIREEKERIEAEAKRQEELAKKDFEEIGISLVRDGRRVDPRQFTFMINKNHPKIQEQLTKRESKYIYCPRCGAKQEGTIATENGCIFCTD